MLPHACRSIRRSLILSASILGLAAAASASAEAAEAGQADPRVTLPSDEIVVTGAQARLQTAPTKVLLDASEPMSVVSDSFIHDSTPPTGNYDTSIKITPSANSANINGPGLANGLSLSIRGFTDGQFNVTFDGIPFGDSTNFAHNSATWFTNRYLNSIAVDRGPGTAATLGDATFGGTVSLFSKAPETHLSIAPYASYGTGNTWQYGGEFNTGAVDALGGAKLMLNAERVTSDGYLTYSRERRTNIFGKLVVPIGDRTTLTFAGMYNEGDQPKLPGATIAEIAKYGKDYSLNDNPRSVSYWRFNRGTLNNDFEYGQLRSELSDSAVLSNTAYSYHTNRTYRNTSDPNGATADADVVAGRLDNSRYRAYGDILRFTQKTRWVDLQFGALAEKNDHDAYQYSVNYTPTTIENPAHTKTKDILSDSLTTLQPYVELDIHPIAGLTLTPGVRYVYFKRSIDATVNKNTLKPLDASVSFKSWLPSASANYKITSEWSVYAQVAKGYLAPEVDYLYVLDPSKSNISPEQTVNYQAGTSFARGPLTLAADVYRINFKNLIVGTAVSGGDTLYRNVGGAIYKGIEAEMSYRIGHGFSIYANGSINSAKDKTQHLTLPESPNATAAAGLQFERHGYTAALIDKWVGRRYGDVGESYRLDPYNQLDFNVGHEWAHGIGPVPPFKLNLQVSNLLNSRSLYSYSANTAAGDPLYFVQPGRSVFVSLSFKP